MDNDYGSAAKINVSVQSSVLNTWITQISLELAIFSSSSGEYEKLSH